MARRTLTETITEKANATWARPHTGENFAEWVEHWMATGEQLHTEMAAEGLTKTCEHIRQVLDFTRACHPKKELA